MDEWTIRVLCRYKVTLRLSGAFLRVHMKNTTWAVSRPKQNDDRKKYLSTKEVGILFYLSWLVHLFALFVCLFVRVSVMLLLHRLGYLDHLCASITTNCFLHALLSKWQLKALWVTAIFFFIRLVLYFTFSFILFIFYCFDTMCFSTNLWQVYWIGLWLWFIDVFKPL